MAGCHHAPRLGLTDGCPGCEYLARHPGELDGVTLRHIWTSSWHSLGTLDRLVREAITRALELSAVLSQAYEYEDYNPRADRNVVHPPLTYRELYTKRGSE